MDKINIEKAPYAKAVRVANQINARLFQAANILGVVERANEILSGLESLALEEDEALEFAKLRSEDRPDRWERAAWILATLELADRIAMQREPETIPAVVNGNFEPSKGK